MSAPQKIIDLVAQFERNSQQYTEATYNETQTRIEFIDPFWEELGWDIHNEKGAAAAYRDVIHEFSLKFGGATKAPDYGFRIGGMLKFFLEAKKPSINIKGDPVPAYQLRRYGWTGKLPLSVLTDFDELAVYDCRIKPDQNDKASTARILYYRYTDYVEKWDEIESIFSFNAILQGSFDKFVESVKGKKGTGEVDDEFLKEIEDWRLLLAKDLYKNNDLNQRELNYAVQKTIDRLIFLRMCEDRGIEQYGQLLALQGGKDIYKRLQKIYLDADDRYNSGLFHFEKEKDRHGDPDNLTLNLTVADKTLEEILSRMYYPRSPYEFSMLPTEVLGNVYEQFLGRVIRLTPKQVKVEEKPEVKKAGGVYYTPQYIVDYIVENTVGELCEGKTPKEVAKLKVLDPACGSGSFLLGAYQYLLNWHLDYYTSEYERTGTIPQVLPPPGSRKRKGLHTAIFDAGKDGWQLTTPQRKQILLNNIYGVDIDNQAVEVTKLSLLLKVLEGEKRERLDQWTGLFKERALPDLSDNVKCGNSLIGPEILAERLFDDEELYKVNPMDWQTEFGDIFKQGGFDAVIGNPPYVVIEDSNRDEDELKYIRKNFISASYKIDKYHIFIERGVRVLAKNGYLSFITPSNFLTNNGLTVLRKFMLDYTSILELNVINGKVFPNASVDNAIFVLYKGRRKWSTMRYSSYDEDGFAVVKETSFEQKIFFENENLIFTGTERMDIRVPHFELGEEYNVNFGMQLRDRKKFPSDVIDVSEKELRTNYHQKCYTGKDIKRYLTGYSNLFAYVNREAKRGGCWDEATHCTSPKILVRQIGKHPICCLDQEGLHCLNTLFMITPKLQERYNVKFILGILNSQFLRYYWETVFFDMRTTFPKIKGSYLKKLPIPDVEEKQHDKLVSLVNQMLTTQEKVQTASGHQKTVLERQIAAIDKQIDTLVYELYGLTDEEIKIVEDGN